ncbi:MAG: glutamate--cysteine ligase [Myxococcota bacterium]|nr:glutamate--cysteine ligase [Myxococcota bacterium]
MGQEVDRTRFTDADFARFDARMREELALLHRVADGGGLSRAGFVVGFELEAWLVDHGLVPAPVNDAYLATLADPLVVPELSRFNVELNGTPCGLGGTAFSALAEELEGTWRRCLDVSHRMDAALVMIGILPTIRRSDLTLANVSALRRYAALYEQIMRLRAGRPVQLDIDGDEPLRLANADVMFEAATTSFQVHLQVPAELAVRFYNASLLASAPVLAAATNSPFLFGHRLWHETRVPLFEQAVATDPCDGPERRRVTFGSGWMRESIVEHFDDVVAHFPVLVPHASDDPPERFPHLRFHNGTIWHWNRPLIGFDADGTPHVRIEHRVLPAGPSLLDMVANAAFYVGLASGLGTLSRPPERDLPFDAVRANFLAAARDGLAAEIIWLDGRPRAVRTLLLEELLPIARQGLVEQGVDADESAHWLGIVEQRVRTGITGSVWQRRWIERNGPDFQRLLADYLEHQRSGAPVHEWPA